MSGSGRGEEERGGGGGGTQGLSKKRGREIMIGKRAKRRGKEIEEGERERGE